MAGCRGGERDMACRWIPAWRRTYIRKLAGSEATKITVVSEDASESLEKKKFVSICLAHPGPEHLTPSRLFEI